MGSSTLAKTNRLRTCATAPVRRQATLAGPTPGQDAGPRAVLRITEFNPGIAGGNDLVELKVIGGGSIRNFTFEQGIVSARVLATLPGAVVAAGDVIVIHVTPETVGVVSESNTKTDCSDINCYAAAWDVAGSASYDIGNSARVLVIKDPTGAIQDGVAF